MSSRTTYEIKVLIIRAAAENCIEAISENHLCSMHIESRLTRQMIGRDERSLILDCLPSNYATGKINSELLEILLVEAGLFIPGIPHLARARIDNSDISRTQHCKVTWLVRVYLAQRTRMSRSKLYLACTEQLNLGQRTVITVKFVRPAVASTGASSVRSHI